MDAAVAGPHGVPKSLRSLAFQMEGEGGGVWVSFKRHLRFLKETGFVDEMDRLTPDGFWASKLRLDHPLLIAEAIRKGAFSQVSPEITAGCIAPFVWDRVQEVELKIESPVDLNACEAGLFGDLTVHGFWKAFSLIHPPGDTFPVPGPNVPLCRSLEQEVSAGRGTQERGDPCTKTANAHRNHLSCEANS